MSNKTIGLSDELHAYVVRVGVREADVLRRLREETASLPQHGMQIAPEQGAFMAMLVELTGARRCIALGTFTGYSSTVVALALPDDGELVCCAAFRVRGISGAAATKGYDVTVKDDEDANTAVESGTTQMRDVTKIADAARQADCTAILIPSATIGCASPCALPMVK